MELEELYPELIVPDSPTQRVVMLCRSPATVRHAQPMLSLSNAFDEDEVSALLTVYGVRLGDLEFVCELKIDGLVVSL